VKLEREEQDLQLVAEEEGESYTVDSASTESLQTILSVTRFGNWVLKNYSGGGLSPDPRHVEIFYFSDRVKKYAASSDFSYGNDRDKTTIYFSPLIVKLKDENKKQFLNLIYKALVFFLLSCSTFSFTASMSISGFLGCVIARLFLSSHLLQICCGSICLIKSWSSISRVVSRCIPHIRL
jgi:hypothetical protein